MAEINPDPYKEGDPLGPTGRITAIIESFADQKGALTELKNNGFRGSKVAVFVGAEGAKQLDGDGEIRSISLLKSWVNTLCDEGVLFDEFETALAAGEAVFSVAVADDEGKKNALVAILKSHHARKIVHWGYWQNVWLA